MLQVWRTIYSNNTSPFTSYPGEGYTDEHC
jgi:hypothetical protein